jgi:hypothetical protein
MPPVRFEPTISAGERPQIYAEYLNCISKLMSRICDLSFDLMRRNTESEDLEPESFISISPVWYSKILFLSKINLLCFIFVQ